MNDIKRLATRLPLHRISRREMFVAKQKKRIQEFKDVNYPVVYRYVKKFMKWIGAELTDPNEKYLFTCPKCKKLRNFKMFGEQVYREKGICLGCNWIGK